MVDRFPNVKRKGKLAIVSISVNAPVTISGFGVPFHSPDDEVTSWVNDNLPIGDGVDLHSFLRQETFTFLVNERAVDAKKRFDADQLPPPFRYPYGESQYWDLQQLKAEANTIRGHRFEPRYR
jgi:hypothetical protein